MGLNLSKNRRLFEPLGTVEAVPNDSVECHRGERSVCGGGGGGGESESSLVRLVVERASCVMATE